MQENNKDFYVWIDEKLSKDFKEKIESNSIENYGFPIGSEQLSLWYLLMLKEEGKTNEEIHKIFKEIFEKISKKASSKIFEAWCGYTPSDYEASELLSFILNDMNNRTISDLETFKQSHVKHFVKSGKENYEEDDFRHLEIGEIPFKRCDDKQSEDNSLPEELNLIIEEDKDIERSLIDFQISFETLSKEFENYFRFKKFMQKLNQRIVDGSIKQIELVSNAILCCNPAETAEEAFSRIYGNDKKFKEENYTKFEKYYEKSKLKWKNIQFYNPYDYLPDDNVSEQGEQTKKQEPLNVGNGIEKDDKKKKSRHSFSFKFCLNKYCLPCIEIKWKKF